MYTYHSILLHDNDFNKIEYKYRIELTIENKYAIRSHGTIF